MEPFAKRLKVGEENARVRRPEMRDFPTAASIIEFAQSGRVREIAPGMQALIGMDMDQFRRIPAKDAACRFFERYTGKSILKKEQARALPFSSGNGRTRKWLRRWWTTSFFMKRYVGSAPTLQLAEGLAFEQFRNDPDVLEVCRNLPPPLENIRRRVQMKSYQKEALTAEGHNPAAIFKQLGDDLYLAFRDMGCRTATWDCNFWMHVQLDLIRQLVPEAVALG